MHAWVSQKLASGMTAVVTIGTVMVGVAVVPYRSLVETEVVVLAGESLMVKDERVRAKRFRQRTNEVAG
jgi:hypothetical protein